LSEQKPHVRPCAIKVVSRNCERFLQSFFRPCVVGHIRGLPGAARQGEGEGVVGLKILRVFLDQPVCLGDASLCRRRLSFGPRCWSLCECCGRGDRDQQSSYLLHNLPRLFWGRIRGRQLRPAARSNALLHRADAAGLTSAALLSGTRVTAVAAAVCRENVRKRRSVAVLIGVHSITDACTELDGIGENADNGSARHGPPLFLWGAPLATSREAPRPRTPPLLRVSQRTWQ